VPIPSEEDVRGVRQLPIETDPPEHTDYRAVVEPFFRRALKPEVAARVERLMETSLADAMSRESIEIVREFALPVQSRALALLLNVPESEAEEWIGWGTHVFRDGDGEKKGAALENHIQSRLDRAEASPGDDFFSALTKAEFRGRPLTRDEMVGYVNLTFAGGRDTIIQSIAGIIAWFCDHPEGLEFLREDSKRIPVAVEEFTRAITPTSDACVRSIPKSMAPWSAPANGSRCAGRRRTSMKRCLIHPEKSGWTAGRIRTSRMEPARISASARTTPG
jgi:cytochrome P450